MNITNSYNLLADNPFSTGGGGSGGGGTTVIIADNLTTNLGTQALSARQGVVLKAMIDDLQTQIDNSTITIDDASLIQKGIVKLNDSIDSTSITEAATPNAVRKAIAEAKSYIDDVVSQLNINGGLVKSEYVITPTAVGQTDIEIPSDEYTPDKFAELVFFNTTKLLPDKYTIEKVDPSNPNSRYKIVLDNPITSLSSIFDIVLLSESSIFSNLTKYEYILSLNSAGQTTMVIPLEDYKPENYIDLLFYNTTKLHPDKYTIEKVDPSDPNTKYQVRLITAPANHTSAIYDLVLISNGVASTSYSNKIYEGTVPPSNNALIWYSTS